MALPPNSFLETIIAFLLPYFSAASMDKHEARSEILDTLASYETRTRAEMLQAAHIIAFGMTTLDVLAEAKTAEMYNPCACGTVAAPTPSIAPPCRPKRRSTNVSATNFQPPPPR